MSEDPATDSPPPLEPSGPVAGRAERYPCPRCHADTTLEPGADALVCAHCGNRAPIPPSDVPIHEHDLHEALASVRRGAPADLAAGGREVQCENCGARTVTTAQAQRCPFCDHALVIELGRSEDSIVPTAVLPFAIPRDRAGSLFVAWLGKRWFAPSDLTRRAAREGLDGVYLPYWTYDSDTTTAYRGERGDYYYVSESYRDAQGNQRTRQVRRTRWSFASGTIYLEFDDVLVCATPSLPGPLVDKLEPWDLGSLRPFDGKYLAGFMAERYRVDLEAGFQRAEQRMEPRIRDAIRADIGGDEQRIGSMKVRHEHVTFKHVLLPLWLSAFRYRDRVFRVSINARTGEVSGERPWSWVKITLLVLAIVAAIVGIIWLAHRG